jgi:DNA-binding CsgD family transcriptional regulator
MHTASVELQGIIPFDETAGIFDTPSGKNLEGIGKSEAVTAAYNNYYRTKRPNFSTCIVDWRTFDGTEYAVDFLFPNGMYKCLRHVIAGSQIYICINRSRLSPRFSDTDLDTLAVIDDYLNSLYTGLDARSDIADPALTSPAIRDRFHSLSRREAEVCSLVGHRLSTAEIAACLFISPRTVEKHVECIFDKLDVSSREQLRWRLGVLPAVGQRISMR